MPPAAFRYWPYLAVAIGGALLAFFFSRALRRFALPIDFLDAAGLSLFFRYNLNAPVALEANEKTDQQE